ncbi:MAG: class I SAM-dependent methyltransferase [Ilumatobacter sp.]|uniref:class I SAM-dependent DNA methyltransferase n=1 Tax=Ilumatobacter sp. TaxID=1967498 RepID=UPI00260E59AA|nr:class I SAM-dependent methyltransferase [Ilumatobacter sp.]MDJ0770526.1 class I SAM-dependent methyltransferase [Ilumatobacter sp.]
MSDWDEYAADWDENAAVRAYADGAFASLTSLAASIGFDLDGVAACDFGCGTGTLTDRLADRCERIDAVDTSPAMLTVLRGKIERHGWPHVRPLGELPATPQGYGLIVCSSVLGFVDDYATTVETLLGHLEPGGLFVQWDWEANPVDDEPYGLTRAAIARTLEASGLDDVAVGIGFEVTVDGDTMRPLIGSGRRSSAPDSGRGAGGC